MADKKRKYLFDNSEPLTRYAVTKIRKIIKNQNESIPNESDANQANETFDIPTCSGNSLQQNEVADVPIQESIHNIEVIDDVPPVNIEKATHLVNNNLEHEANSDGCCRSLIHESFVLRLHENSNPSEEIEPHEQYGLLSELLTSTFQGLSYNQLNENNVATVEDLYSSDEEVIDILRRENTRLNSIDNLMHQDGFLQSIPICSERSPGEMLLMAIKFSLAHNLSFTAITNLMRLINCICGTKILPDTRYLVDKLCSPNNNSVTFHCVCPTCTKYIGKFEDIEKYITCKKCDTIIDVANPSNPCFFAIIDPSDSVRDYIQCHEDYYDYIVKERVHEKNHIKDIYDGKLYREFLKNLPASDRYSYVTTMFNTDGAPVYESSNVSIWPIYLIINEIPVQNRFNSVVVTGLWFGKNKPEMSVFLQVYVETMNNLSKVGIQCTIKGESRRIKLFSLIACVDTIARALMNGSIQFNGYFGCDWCMHPGTYHGGSMRYEYLTPSSIDRDLRSTILFAKEAIRTSTSVFGIKSASPLLNLQCFDIIRGFVPDYMHCILNGVAQQLTENLLKNYLSNEDLNCIDNLFTSIKVPHQLYRLARPLKERSNWKAREWENWVLYYSVPLLSTVLKDKKRLKHWALLTESLHISLQVDITYEELNRLRDLLHQFVLETENLYSIDSMTYNVHQLLHLSDSIFNWGPNFAHSTFPFEAANHKLLLAIKSAKGVILQIIRYINLQRFEKILEKIVYSASSPIVLQFSENIDAPRSKKYFQISDIVYFGTGKIVNQYYTMNFNVSNSTKLFSKLVMKQCLFTASTKINQRSCNYFAQLTDDRFIKINQFLVDVENENEITVCEVVQVIDNKYSQAVKDVVRISNQMIAVPTKEICKSSIYIETDLNNVRKAYIIPVPNTFYY